MAERKEGWTWLSNSRKWHYFRNNESLCGKFLILSDGALEQGNDTSPDNCAACKKKLKKEARVEFRECLKDIMSRGPNQKELDLELFRIRWRRWLGNKTRIDKPYWIDLLGSNWLGWAQQVCNDAELPYVPLPHTAPREVVKSRYLNAINHASMDQLYKLDSIYCEKKHGL